MLICWHHWQPLLGTFFIIRFETGSQHIRIQIIPLLARHHEQSAMTLGVDQTLRRQHLDHLAQHISRGLEALAQLGLKNESGNGRGAAGWFFWPTARKYLPTIALALRRDAEAIVRRELAR